MDPYRSFSVSNISHLQHWVIIFLMLYIDTLQELGQCLQSEPDAGRVHVDTHLAPTENTALMLFYFPFINWSSGFTVSAPDKRRSTSQLCTDMLWVKVFTHTMWNRANVTVHKGGSTKHFRFIAFYYHRAGEEVEVRDNKWEVECSMPKVWK